MYTNKFPSRARRVGGIRRYPRGRSGAEKETRGRRARHGGATAPPSPRALTSVTLPASQGHEDEDADGDAGDGDGDERDAEDL
jgi:hypothetical protein